MPFCRTSLLVFMVFLFTGMTRASTVQHDTLMPSDISYIGYRIYIRNLKVLKQKGKEFQLQMELVNTGKRPVSFGPGFPARYLQTRFDESLHTAGLLELGLLIREALLKTRETLEVGEWKSGLELLVRADDEIEIKTLSKDNFEKVKAPILRAPVRSNQMQEEEKATFVKTDSACIDLTLSEIKLLQKSKKIATLQITLSNGGSNPFPLKNINEGLSLSLFVSGSPRLSSSSKRLKQIDLTRLLAMQGKASLLEGEDIVLVERVDISDATRYTAVLIAQIDSGQVLEECDETNNEAHGLLFD